MKQRKKALLCGVTGGIGSGKSAVCRLLGVLLPGSVYNADNESKRLVDNDLSLRGQIVELLGADAYLPSGAMNRGWVAERVFDDKILLSKLNAIIHPAVLKDMRRWVDWRMEQGGVLSFVESAILIESGWITEFDRVIVVTAPSEIRAVRVMERDALSRDRVAARMAHQMAESERLRYANDIIYCDEEHLMIPQVVDLFDRLMKDI